MSGRTPSLDLGAEREIDLRAWRDATLAYWWIAAAALVIGAVIGGVYSLSGGSSFTASATIARGVAFNPAGNAIVLPYLTSPTQIQKLVTAPATIDKVAANIGLTRAQLLGHVTASTVTAEGVPSPTNTGSILIIISVTLNKPRKAEDAANAFARLVKKYTTTSYVVQSIHTLESRIENYSTRIATLNSRISSLTRVLQKPAGLTPLEQLVVSTQLDTAEGALGQTLDSQSTSQLQLVLDKTVETTQILPPPAKAVKSVARSRRNSVVFGAVIGLLAGALVALYMGVRHPRNASPAT